MTQIRSGDVVQGLYIVPLAFSHWLLAKASPADKAGLVPTSLPFIDAVIDFIFKVFSVV